MAGCTKTAKMRRRAGAPGGVRHRALASAMAAALLWLAPPLVALGAPANIEAHHAKAAFIIYFAKFVEWPPKVASRDGPMVICTATDEGLYMELNVFAGTFLRNRVLVVKRVGRGDDLKDCQVLVVDDSAGARVPELLHAVASAPVLTVGDDLARFTQAGGMIELSVVEDRVQFDVNVEAAQRAELAMSAQLVKLSRDLRKRRRL